MELRILKKATESSKEKAGNRGGATAGLIKKKVNSAAAARAIHVSLFNLTFLIYYRQSSLT